MSDAPRRLIVLRHGQTTHNADNIWQGQLDSRLSLLGEEQARYAARALARRGLALVVASDLSRAARTGEEVARECGIPCTTDARFREIHAGGWQGMRGEDVHAAYPQDMERLLRGEDFRRGGDGETVADVAARCREGVDELLGRLEPGQSALIATHGVAGRTLAAELAGLPQMTAWTALAGLGNCHWAELVEGRVGWRIHSWNEHAGAPGEFTSLA